jgi:predicted metal-dependent hydrolase
MKPSTVTPLSAKTQPNVLPTRRDIRFDLPAEHIADWSKGSIHLSQFMNTLSIFFPVGERFFIDAVRQYRDQITDPELQKAVTAFIGQEAMHGREHEEYNELLFARVPEAAQVERFVFALLENVKKLPPRMRLSATIALEHFTAIMADGLLRDPRVLEGAEPRYARLWRWHALEETEHKAVAFDVWDKVMGRGTGAYLERSAGMVLATVIFWSIMVPAYLAVIRREGKLTDLKGWRFLAQNIATKVPFFPRLLKPYMDYFRRDFHPWDHDNRHFLEQIDSTLGELRAAA